MTLYPAGRMQRIDTRLAGLVLLEPDVHGDPRGFFLESYRANVWAQHGIDDVFVQDNHSRSRRGVLRGMHVSIGAGQAKLVR
ncbi:MAG: dTDP-4-dehydrorhamnose 3,5-epimerase family protein, partial [Solirubrobacteraceae bacterium]